MQTLFVLDRHDYDHDMPVQERECVRAIILDNDRLLVQKSSRGEYKLPGGGIERNESVIDTLHREVFEETGRIVKEDSEATIGEIIEKRLDVYSGNSIYLNHTYFFSCSVSNEQYELHLTPEEQQKGYKAVWEPIDVIISGNDSLQQDYWRRRDTLFLKWYRDHVLNHID